MGVTTGTGAGEYIAVVDHVSNGEQASEQVLRRPSVQLENRADALKTFVEQEEMRLTGVKNTSDTHIADSALHTVFASDAEAKAGTNIVTVLSPKLLNVVITEMLGVHYNAIVGTMGRVGVTHATIAEAIAAVGANAKILVAEDQVLDAIVNIPNDALELEVKKGVTILTSEAFVFNVAAKYCGITGGAYTGATTAVVNIEATGIRTLISNLRNIDSPVEIVDDGEYNKFTHVYTGA